MHKLRIRSQQEARKRNISTHVASHSRIDSISRFDLFAGSRPYPGTAPHARAMALAANCASATESQGSVYRTEERDAGAMYDSASMAFVADSIARSGQRSSNSNQGGSLGGHFGNNLGSAGWH